MKDEKGINIYFIDDEINPLMPANELNNEQLDLIIKNTVITLDKAIKSAFKDAESGENLLLSPGTASYDQFKNYSERGEKFAFWVKQEGK